MYRFDSRMRRALVALAGAAVAASFALTALAPAASAKIPLPTVTALHAAIIDPVYAGTQGGDLLYGKKPNEQTAMGSTTKIWTLDLTAQALADHYVSVDDFVTINADEASHQPPNESSMTDVNGTPLEKGEIVKFGDLIRGMMYPSGNNATYAIADHIARAYYGPGSDWHDFVGMMNGFAASLGQVHTHFANPAGLDNNAHYTTAQELAAEFQHVLQDPFAAQVLGFKGTYIANTFGLTGTKTYKFTNGNPYVGWEGEKNGITPNCSGPAKGCIVRAATRIGRRVVVATMQGTRGAEENAMLDYGFANIFHPDYDGASAGGAVDRQALDCFGSDSAVTATLLSSGAVNLTLWKKGGASISKVQSAAVLGAAGVSDVAVTRLASGDIVVATARGGALTLARWGIVNGSLHLLAKDIPAGPASTVGLQPVANDMFLSAAVAPDGTFLLESWQLQGTSLVNVGSYVQGSSSNPFSEVAISGPLQSDVFGGTNAVTAEIQGSDLHVTTWAVDPATGLIAMAGITRNYNSNFHKVSIAPVAVTPQPWEQLFTPTYYALGHTVPGGLRTDFLRLGGGEFGGVATPQFQGSTPVIAGDRIKLAALGTGGVMAAVDIPGESTQLQAWDAHRNLNDSITPTQVAQENEAAASSLNLCRVPVAQYAEGRFFTGTKELDGQLHVRAYRSGDRPY